MSFLTVYQKWLQQMLTANGGRNILTIEGDILEYMAATDLLKPGEVETIKHCVTPLSKNNAFLLKILPGKGAKGFDGLIQALTLNGYEDLAVGLVELARMQIGYVSSSGCASLVVNPVQEAPDSNALAALQKRIAELEKSLIDPRNEAVRKAKEYYVVEEERLKKLEQQHVLQQPGGIIKNMEVTLADAPDIKLVNSAYSNFTNPKGLVLLINNRSFDDETLPERLGTDVDASNVTKLFTNLGYEVSLEQDQTAEQIRDKLKEFANNEKHKRTSSAVVVVLSHGGEGVVYGTDGKTVPVSDIIDGLNANNCNYLQGKPKIFIFQACRGERKDTGSTESDGLSLSDSGKEEMDGIRRKIATDADILMGFATTPGYVSWRNTVRGSWYIETLCQVFSKKACSKHVLDLLTEVNGIVHERESTGGHKSIPQTVSQLTKDFYFFPGYYK